jgi:hypothetical protein
VVIETLQSLSESMVVVAKGLGGVDVEGGAMLLGQSLQVHLLTVEDAFAVVELVHES